MKWIDDTIDLRDVKIMDTFENSHTVEQTVNSPEEIQSIVDALSYKKGSAIVRMLYNLIGDDNFRKGMEKYLTKFMYKNTETSDLWKSFEGLGGKTGGLSINKIMSTWTLQKGYPLISVAKFGPGSRVAENLTVPHSD